MKIEKSTDWNKVENELKFQLKQVNYNKDLQKLLNNITLMVQNLSKQEVTCRRNHNYEPVNNLLVDINDTILRLEKLILIAKLVS